MPGLGINLHRVRGKLLANFSFHRNFQFCQHLPQKIYCKNKFGKEELFSFSMFPFLVYSMNLIYVNENTSVIWILTITK